MSENKLCVCSDGVPCKWCDAARVPCALCSGKGFYGQPGMRCSYCKGTGRLFHMLPPPSPKETGNE